MSKAVKIGISVFVILIVVGIFLTMYFTIFKKEEKVDLTLSTYYLTMYVGETKDLKDCYTVSNSNKLCISCFVNDLTFAEISEDNILTAKCVGSTKIIFKNGNLKFEEDYINLTIVERPIIPSSFSFDKSEITLSLETEFAVNNIICNETYNVTPTITYSINNICEYNLTTGKIIPLSEGTTIVTVSFVNDNATVSNSFTVIVKNNYRNLSINLTKTNDYYILSMSANINKHFSVYVIENDVEVNNVKLKFEFLDNSANVSLLQFEGNIAIVKAKNLGTSTLKISCEDDSSIFALIKIEVE